MIRTNRFALLAVAPLFAACASTATDPMPLLENGPATPSASTAATHAGAELRDREGAVIGTVRFTEDATGRVHVNVHAKGVSPGLHGLHLHAIGTCDASTGFTSAGGHYNPTGKEHGHHNPAGHHSGDLPNLIVNEAGVGRLNWTTEQFGLAELFDQDGTAVVLHANEDDLTTNNGDQGPGNSGARIACGVVSR